MTRCPGLGGSHYPSPKDTKASMPPPNNPQSGTCGTSPRDVGSGEGPHWPGRPLDGPALSPPSTPCPSSSPWWWPSSRVTRRRPRPFFPLTQGPSALLPGESSAPGSPAWRSQASPAQLAVSSPLDLQPGGQAGHRPRTELRWSVRRPGVSLTSLSTQLSAPHSSIPPLLRPVRRRPATTPPTASGTRSPAPVIRKAASRAEAVFWSWIREWLAGVGRPVLQQFPSPLPGLQQAPGPLCLLCPDCAASRPPRP